MSSPGEDDPAPQRIKLPSFSDLQQHISRLEVEEWAAATSNSSGRSSEASNFTGPSSSSAEHFHLRHPSSRRSSQYFARSPSQPDQIHVGSNSNSSGGGGGGAAGGIFQPSSAISRMAHPHADYDAEDSSAPKRRRPTLTSIHDLTALAARSHFYTHPPSAAASTSVPIGLPSTRRVNDYFDSAPGAGSAGGIAHSPFRSVPSMGSMKRKYSYDGLAASAPPPAEAGAIVTASAAAPVGMPVPSSSSRRQSINRSPPAGSYEEHRQLSDGGKAARGGGPSGYPSEYAPELPQPLQGSRSVPGPSHAGPVPGYGAHDPRRPHEIDAAHVGPPGAGPSYGGESDISRAPYPSANSDNLYADAEGPRRGNYPRHVTEHLKAWLFSHREHPYPTDHEKRELAHFTNLTMTQLNNWLINARRRLLRDVPAQTVDVYVPSRAGPGQGAAAAAHAQKHYYQQHAHHAHAPPPGPHYQPYHPPAPQHHDSLPASHSHSHSHSESQPHSYSHSHSHSQPSSLPHPSVLYPDSRGTSPQQQQRYAPYQDHAPHGHHHTQSHPRQQYEYSQHVYSHSHTHSQPPPLPPTQQQQPQHQQYSYSGMSPAHERRHGHRGSHSSSSASLSSPIQSPADRGAGAGSVVASQESDSGY